MGHYKELKEEGEKQNFHHKNKKEKKQNKTERDPSNARCYTCDEKGNFARGFPIKKKRHHAHVSKDDEPKNKIFRREKDDFDEEYMIISTLIGTISHGSNDWLVDSRESKYILGYKESFINIFEHESPHKVKLWDDYQYPIKGVEKLHTIQTMGNTYK